MLGWEKECLKKWLVFDDNLILAFCRGNSFIYAGGGWNKHNSMTWQDSLDAYRNTLLAFNKILTAGGYLLLDKFKDDEVCGKTKLTNVTICNKDYELLFYTRQHKDLHRREAALILRDEVGVERCTPNETYLLSSQELNVLCKQTGFVRCQMPIDFSAEKHFGAWLLRKT